MTTSKAKKSVSLTHIFGVFAFIAIVSGVGYALYREFGTVGPQLTLVGNDVFQLREGAPLKLKGVDIGRVVAIAMADEQAAVTVELSCDQETARRLSRSSTEFSVARFVNTELQWKDAQTVLHGSHLVAELGDPTANAIDRFALRVDPPRDARISWESPRVQVTWEQVYGLSYGAPMSFGGQQIGCVDGMTATDQGIVVVLAFFASSDSRCRYAVAGTSFYVKRFEGTNLEVRGVETLVKGTHVIVVPGDPKGEPCKQFVGIPDSAPDPRIRWDSLRCDVHYANTFGLQVGAGVASEGRTVGVIEAVAPVPHGLRVRCAFFEPSVRYVAKDARFYISRFATERLEVQGVEATIRGPQIVIVPGNSAEPLAEHIGSLELPPNPRVRADSPRLVVRWQNVQGLQSRAPVLWQGYQIGEVESIAAARPGQKNDVHLVYFVDDPQYRAASNRLFVNVASLNSRGLQGEASTVLKGPHVDVVLDPLGTTTVVDSIDGAEGAPPQFVPRAGEAGLVLESPVWLDAYAPLISRRQIVGYVLRCERASDNRSFFVTARVYPEGQDLIKRNSVFFLPPKIRATLFSRDGWSLQGPRVEVPDLQSFLQAGIEFRTPPDGGEPVEFGRPPRFPLHLEPEPEWLLWHDAPAPSVQRVRLPTVVATAISWRRSRIGFSTEHAGVALPIGNSLIGPQELLMPTLTGGETEAELFRCSFTVNGLAVDRSGATVTPLAHGLTRLTFKEAPTWETNPQALAAAPKAPVDLVLVATNQQLAVDRRRLTTDQVQWIVDGTDVPQAFHGAAAVVSDEANTLFGKVVGIVVIADKRARIVWLPMP